MTGLSSGRAPSAPLLLPLLPLLRLQTRVSATLDGQLKNMTRSCGPEECNIMHMSPQDVYCDQNQESLVCTQCCADSLCNGHLNGAGGASAAPLAALLSVALAAVALVGS